MELIARASRLRLRVACTNGDTIIYRLQPARDQLGIFVSYVQKDGRDSRRTPGRKVHDAYPMIPDAMMMSSLQATRGLLVQRDVILGKTFCSIARCAYLRQILYIESHDDAILS